MPSASATASNQCFGLFTAIITALSLAGCGGSSSPQNPDNTLAAAAAVKKDYSQAATLNLVKTGDALVTRKSNLVHMTGEGTQSTYTIQYKFNSGANTQFRLLEIQRVVHNSGGEPVADIQGSLIQGTSSVPIKLNMTKALVANTDYILQFQHPQNSAIFDLTLDVLAWAGDASVINPDLARSCQTKLGTIVFFAANNISGYLTAPEKKLYIGPEQYCGEPFVAQDSTCHVSRESMTADFPNKVTCSAGKNPSEKSFEVSFDHKLTQPRIICRNNGMPETTIALTSCSDSVMDSSTFLQIVN